MHDESVLCYRTAVQNNKKYTDVRLHRFYGFCSFFCRELPYLEKEGHQPTTTRSCNKATLKLKLNINMYETGIIIHEGWQLITRPVV